eukprot:1770505-Rhodomonas_salina.1
MPTRICIPAQGYVQCAYAFHDTSTSTDVRYDATCRRAPPHVSAYGYGTKCLRGPAYLVRTKSGVWCYQRRRELAPPPHPRGQNASFDASIAAVNGCNASVYAGTAPVHDCTVFINGYNASMLPALMAAALTCPALQFLSSVLR